MQQKQTASALQPRIITGTFLDEMSTLLTGMERQRVPTPTFVFIDPFGYSHAPLSIITRSMRLPMCEVLINFMYDEINRFLTASSPPKEQHYDHLFGTTEWRQIAQAASGPAERQRLLHDLYRHQLLTTGGAKYVRPFRMRNEHNATDYFLFFCTKNRRGLEEMKRTMWGVDQTGGFEFSDFSNPYQPLLLTQPNYEDLQRLLTQHFKGKIVKLDDIREYVLAETPYVNYKKEALKLMETDSPPKIRIIHPPLKRVKGTFADDTMLVEFL
jgi:hypothetical protein